MGTRARDISHRRARQAGEERPENCADVTILRDLLDPRLRL